ncbi:hypothetical protein HMPREF3027_07215 [Porphyromonas sp. HMSC077F02]|uniref:hypothetical protein n=1 Tax=Porphyromonas sp. HMSC077F02 TaxID=1739529 RepID=UPI0008A43432|nr:hypothetical protein [Porphyromonas sp. HMSC077F02]OFO52017.1 hypothetical protein HMPREF3027_07215 [Porphyromonas sp. HMSC077F02]
MNRLVLSLLAVLLLFSCTPKDTHTEFLGISLGEPAKVFIDKLEQKDFTHLDTDRGRPFTHHMLVGTFSGAAGCLVDVMENDYGNIWSVDVTFPSSLSFEDAKSQYQDIKESLVKKYGKTKATSKERIDPSLLSSETEVITAFQSEEAEYKTTINLKNGGYIYLSIEYYDFMGGFCVAISYTDSLSNYTSKEKMSNDL